MSKAKNVLDLLEEIKYNRSGKPATPKDVAAVKRLEKEHKDSFKGIKPLKPAEFGGVSDDAWRFERDVHKASQKRLKKK